MSESNQDENNNNNNNCNINSSKKPCPYFMNGVCKFGDTCLLKHDRLNQNTSTQKPCPYFANGSCKFGISCLFKHEINFENTLNKKLCPHFMNGTCKFDENCLLLHNIDSQNISDKKICSHFINGTCRFGEQCLLKHELNTKLTSELNTKSFVQHSSLYSTLFNPHIEIHSDLKVNKSESKKIDNQSYDKIQFKKTKDESAANKRSSSVNRSRLIDDNDYEDNGLKQKKELTNMNKYLNKNVQALNLKSGAMFKFHKDEENEPKHVPIKSNPFQRVPEVNMSPLKVRSAPQVNKRSRSSSVNRAKISNDNDDSDDDEEISLTSDTESKHSSEASSEVSADLNENYDQFLLKIFYKTANISPSFRVKEYLRNSCFQMAKFFFVEKQKSNQKRIDSCHQYMSSSNEESIAIDNELTQLERQEISFNNELSRLGQIANTPSPNNLLIKNAIDREKRRVEQKLPIYGYRNEIIETLKNNNILVLVGLTGSGKTT